MFENTFEYKLLRDGLSQTLYNATRLNNSILHGLKSSHQEESHYGERAYTQAHDTPAIDTVQQYLTQYCPEKLTTEWIFWQKPATVLAGSAVYPE